MTDLEILFYFTNTFNIPYEYEQGHIIDDFRFYDKWFALDKKGKLVANG